MFFKYKTRQIEGTETNKWIILTETAAWQKWRKNY